MTPERPDAATQQYNWFCMNCGSSMTTTRTVETVMGDDYDIEECVTCGAEVQ